MNNEQCKKRPIVSFCIPTFNRAEKIYALILEILSYSDNDIEVVVLDNCSTDSTKNKLLTISDKRFSFYENEINIGGKDNCLKVLTLGIGEYVCLCLDKDFINHNYIKDLITFIKFNPEVVVGFCSLNIEKIDEAIVYEKGIESVNNIAYLSKHPSGNFYRNDSLQKQNIYDKRDVYNSESGFMFEFVNAEMSQYGKSAKLNFPLISTETKNQASENVSHSYSGDNVFFLPDKQYELYVLYLKHITTLKILKSDKRKLIERLFVEKLLSSTFGFNSLCKDEKICHHYGFKPKKAGILSLIYNDLFFCRKFIITCNYRTIMSRICICAKANGYIAINVFINKIKKSLVNCNIHKACSVKKVDLS